MATQALPTPRPRAFRPDFDEGLPRHWFGGDALLTQLANGVNLLFPAGERFFIRSVVRYMERLGDPALREAVRGFVGQEGHHSQAHERFFAIMEDQGYRIRRFLVVYDKIAYGVIEPLSPPEFRLAVTVALEHFTAIIAEDALRTRRLEMAPPALQNMLFWHAAEEIEHKSVAFEVLKRVNPSYSLRIAGLAMALLTLGGFWTAATIMLLAQDHQLRALGGNPDPTGHLLRNVFAEGIRDYLRRDFHPSQRDNGHLAQSYLASVGLA